MTTRKPIINPIRLVRCYSLLAAGGGIFSLLRLLAVPADQKNAALWGYSSTRLAMLAFVFLGILFFFGLLIATYWKSRWIQGWLDRLAAAIEPPGMPGFYLFTLPLLISLGGLLLLFWTKQTTDQFFQAYLVRLAPVVIWLTALSLLTLLLLICLGYRSQVLLLNTKFAFSTFLVWLRGANLYKLLGISVFLSFLCLGFLYRSLPAYRHVFLAQDQFLEIITSGLFLFAFLLSVLILIINRGGRLTDFGIPVAAGLFSFISKSENDLPAYLPGGLLLILMLLLGYFLLRIFLNQKDENAWMVLGPLVFTLISTALILVALALDLNWIKIPEHRFIKEMLQLSASLGISFGAISIYQRAAFEDPVRFDIRLTFFKFQAWLQRTNLYRVLGISTLISVLSFSLLYLLLPAYRPWFVDEDQFLENLTTWLFLFAFLLSVWILIMNRGGWLTDFTVPVTSLFSFLEEISYGERFSDSIPMLLPDEDIDALHDFFEIGFRFIRDGKNDLLVYLIGGLFTITILLAGYFAVRYFRKGRHKNPWVSFGPLVFTLMSAVFILIALVLDLDVTDNPTYRLIEELLEFSASLAIFFGAISIYQRIILEKK